MTHAEPASRLARHLGVTDAVVIGLGSMIGAGVFAAIGPAARVAGSGLLVGLAIAGVVAYCNASSSASLAAAHPTSGGAYAFGRARLGSYWGFLAGWAFIVGKTAGCAAVALTVGAYAAPSWRRPIALAAVVAVTAVNYRGMRKTAALTRLLVVLVLTSLALVVVGVAAGGHAHLSNADLTTGGATGILQSAGLLFFAFAGYARIATLGEEVRDPAHTIPRAIRIALGITLIVYGVIAVTALAAVGPQRLAASEAPLVTAVGAGRLDVLLPFVKLGGAIAALSVLLSLMAGVSRTAFAMAADREMPTWLSAVHPLHKAPHRAELVAGIVVTVLVATTDLRHAIGFSSFCVLVYYGIANAAAWTLPRDERRATRALAVGGLVGCAALAVTLPGRTITTALVILAVGSLLRLSRANPASAAAS